MGFEGIAPRRSAVRARLAPSSTPLETAGFSLSYSRLTLAWQAAWSQNGHSYFGLTDDDRPRTASASAPITIHSPTEEQRPSRTEADSPACLPPSKQEQPRSKDRQWLSAAFQATVTVPRNSLPLSSVLRQTYVPRVIESTKRCAFPRGGQHPAGSPGFEAA